MKYKSHAKWPPNVCCSMYGDDISTDTHHSKEAADAVCAGLEAEGFGGEGKIFPIKTWVADETCPYGEKA